MTPGSTVLSLSRLDANIKTIYDFHPFLNIPPIFSVVDGKLTAGDFTLIFNYMQSLFGPLTWMGRTWGDVVAALTNLEAVMELHARRPTIVDAPDAKLLSAASDRTSLGFGGELAFENVSFHYERDAELDFKQDMQADSPPLGGIYNVSFRLLPGKVLGLCGATGSGKSTIGRLMMRFYEPDSGRVMLDGLDISKYQQDSLRSSVGVVPQDTVLFDDTLRYNISYGRPDASDDEIWAAVHAAQLTEFVRAQPEGLDMLVGARGAKTSGGERQRIGAARCMCKQPRLVLLDESTSSLDQRTEAAIQESFVRLFAGRTTVVIAHRLATIQHADEILVLGPCSDEKSSSVLERGTHKQLLSRNGSYAAMWHAQTKG